MLLFHTMFSILLDCTTVQTNRRKSLQEDVERDAKIPLCSGSRTSDPLCHHTKDAVPVTPSPLLLVLWPMNGNPALTKWSWRIEYIMLGTAVTYWHKEHIKGKDTLLRRYSVQVKTEPVVSCPATNIDKRSSRNCILETWNYCILRHHFRTKNIVNLATKSNTVRPSVELNNSISVHFSKTNGPINAPIFVIQTFRCIYRIQYNPA